MAAKTDLEIGNGQISTSYVDYRLQLTIIVMIAHVFYSRLQASCDIQGMNIAMQVQLIAQLLNCV